MVSPIGIFFIVLVVLLVVAAVGWVVFTQLRARRLGLPSPGLSSYNPFSRSDHIPRRSSTFSLPSAPAPGSIREWFGDKWQALRGGIGNKRSAAGAYEGGHGSAAAHHQRRGFGPLDPDEAWDTRVNAEADAYGPGGYYEEQELGLRGNNDLSYAGGTTTTTISGGGQYDDYHHQPPPPQGLGLQIPGSSPSPPGPGNPFGDDAEPSNISAQRRMYGSGGDSPTHSERRSIFRENV